MTFDDIRHRIDADADRAISEAIDRIVADRDLRLARLRTLEISRLPSPYPSFERWAAAHVNLERPCN